MQIIIKQISNLIKAPKNSIVIGDLRNEMAKDLMRKLEMVVNQQQHRDDYYILVHAFPDRMQEMVIREKIFVLRTDQYNVIKENKMFGTICLYVNNKTGEVRREWILPLDKPVPIVGDGEYVPSVAEDAKGMGILN
jgi:hypothetical protein